VSTSDGLFNTSTNEWGKPRLSP